MEKKRYIVPSIEAIDFETDLLKVTGPGTPGIDPFSPAPKRTTDVF